MTIGPGNEHESRRADELLDNTEGAVVLADTAYDSNEIRESIRSRGLKAVISSHPNRTRAIPKNRKLYALRYKVECMFHDLKLNRAVATRYEKSGRNFLAALHVACGLLWLNSLTTANN